MSTNPSTETTESTAIVQPENATITGRLTLLSGDPVSGMLVEIYPHCFEGPVLAKTTTGSKGEYIFKNIQPQRYSVAYNNFRNWQESGGPPQLAGLSSKCRNPVYFEAGKNKYIDFLVEPR